MVRSKGANIAKGGDSPRIRGDGPGNFVTLHPRLQFSPYSRGWSGFGSVGDGQALILPVFAGMVPDTTTTTRNHIDSPRIRGDGPTVVLSRCRSVRFSPYSRGWSQKIYHHEETKPILPVFAGMVPQFPMRVFLQFDSPRIRGDGPISANNANKIEEFSPYSRGWSVPIGDMTDTLCILPVFAGMVP